MSLNIFILLSCIHSIRGRKSSEEKMHNFLAQPPYFISVTDLVLPQSLVIRDFWKYFLLKASFHHSLDSKISFHANLVPSLVLTIIGFRIPNPPFSFGNLTAFQLIRGSFVIILSAFPQKVSNHNAHLILSIPFGAYNPEQRYIGR